MRKVLTGIAVLAAVLLAVLAVPRWMASAAAEPAMWVVKDADSTVYLFGTFHLVKPETAWRSDKIAAAFAASGDLWIEASDGGNQAAMQALVMKHGMDIRHPLSSKLSPEVKAKLDEAAADAGLSPAMLEPMRPWTAALAITVAPLMRAGYDPAHGVDRMLEADAKAAHKKVRTFETPEQQILLFAKMPEETEIAFLVQSIEEAEAGVDLIDDMSDAWLAGDLAEVEAISFGPMREKAPELYEMLIVRRNQNWVKQLDRVMKGAGTTFVAVGAGHLTGTHSLQALLEARGFKVARY